MKTKLCKPILIESKEDYGITLGVNITRNIPGAMRGQHYQLILISLDTNDDIKPGDKYYSFETETIDILEENELSMSYDRKVIATQDQLPNEYIQQFVEEYNKYEVKDVEIEMIDNKQQLEECVENIEEICLEEHENIEDSPYYEQYCLAVKDIDNIVYQLKLTNGFITIVKEKPILYTTQEVIKLLDSFGQHVSMELVGRRFEMIGELSKWFETNKKK